jgi:hypothetical protein
VKGNGRFADKLPIVSSLIAQSNQRWEYPYSNSTPTLSVCVGVVSYQYWLLVSNDIWLAVERYNGSSEKAKYKETVKNIYNATDSITVEDYT